MAAEKIKIITFNWDGETTINLSNDLQLFSHNPLKAQWDVESSKG